MTIPPESIEPGKCYLTVDGTIRRVTSTDSDGWVRYSERLDDGTWQRGRPKRLKRQDFVGQVLREVPCDWTPER